MEKQAAAGERLDFLRANESSSAALEVLCVHFAQMFVDARVYICLRDSECILEVAQAPIDLRISSLIGRTACAGLLNVPIAHGNFVYCAEQLHDPVKAVFMLAMQIAEFCLLQIAIFNWRFNKLQSLTGTALWIVAVFLCCSTMYERFSTEDQQRLAAITQASASHVMAVQEYRGASSAITARMREEPPPHAGPRTLAAWEAARQTSLANLIHERDRAKQEIDRASPPERLDWSALILALIAELFCAIGQWVFSLGLARRRSASERPMLISIMWPRFSRVFATIRSVSMTAIPPSPAKACFSEGQRRAMIEERDEPHWHKTARNLLGTMSIPEIATTVGRDKSVVYKFAKREREGV